jgi:hypothetical protein
MSINLTYTEKYLSGRSLRNKNEFLINKTRTNNWHELEK